MPKWSRLLIGAGEELLALVRLSLVISLLDDPEAVKKLVDENREESMDQSQTVFQMDQIPSTMMRPADEKAIRVR